MKREIFYIRGNKDRAAEVKSALLEKYPDANHTECLNTMYDDLYYFVDIHNNVDFCGKDGAFADLLAMSGTELHLPERNESKFYVGDVVKITNTFQDEPLMRITKITGSSISATDGCVRSVEGHPLAKVKRVTDKEINKWNKDYLHTRRWHYSKTDRKLKHWFLPFDKVLARGGSECMWKCDLFSNFMKSDCEVELGNRYFCVGMVYNQCIPYNDETAHLIGTTDDYEGEEL